MNFELTEQQLMFQDLAHKFAVKEILPLIKEYEPTETVCHDLVKKLAANGLLGLTIPQEYGGLGLDTLTSMLVYEQLGWASVSFTTHALSPTQLPSVIVANFGNEDQKKKYLIPACKGEKILGLAAAEPEAGSDGGNIQTTAVLEGDYWVLNGRKNFIGNGSIADTIFVLTSTDKTKGTKGLSIIAVDKDTPGFSAKEVKGKLSFKSADVGNLGFIDCRVPRENLIGEEGKGLRQTLFGINTARLEVAATWLGSCQSCLDSCIKYAKERNQFGKPIGSFQLVQATIAQMSAEIDATRWFIYYVADLVDRGTRRAYREVAEAKLLATELAVRVSTEAVKLHGAYGLINEYPVEHHYRDAIGGTIIGGTSNIQKLFIGQELLGINALSR